MNNLIYIVDDEKAISKLLKYWIGEKWQYEAEVFNNGEDFLRRFNEQQPDLIVLDIMLPGINGLQILKKVKQANENIPAIMLSAQGDVETAVDSIRLGAFDYFSKPIDVQRLEAAIKNAIKNYELTNEIKNLKEKVKKDYSFENIISADKRMQEVFKLVSKVLDNDITVLIHGESGTGKELIAKAIHYNGVRKEKPFIVVNCASIPRELLESELFGHEKGSFTGAHQRKLGKFEMANEGTIFLDEVGELEMMLQAKLLRVIQEREFERVGGTELIKTNVRILSATNRDLREAVKEKQFREDLYYRLNSFPIYIPPLRFRKSDILVLADYFLNKVNKKLNKNIQGFTKNALKLVYEYEWPGNIREMENTIERCIIITDNDLIDVQDLPAHISVDSNANKTYETAKLFESDEIIPFEKLKEDAIRNALEITKGNIVEAAKKLQLGRATIYRLLEKYKIENRSND